MYTTYYRYQYHFEHKGHTGISHGYFVNRGVLLEKLNYWSHSGWHYHETEEDRIKNLQAQQVKLPSLKVGFLGRLDHQSEFNGKLSFTA